MKSTVLYLFILVFFSCADKSSEPSSCSQEVNSFLSLAGNNQLAYGNRLKYNKKASLLLSKLKVDSLSLDKYLNLNKNFCELNSWEDLKSTSEQLYRKSERVHLLYFIGKAYRFKGMYFENKSINDSAIYYYLKAQKIFASIHAQESLCEVYQDEAIVRSYLNDYLGSDKKLIEALRIAKSASLIRNQFDITIQLGNNSNILNDFEKANEYYNKGLEILHKNPLKIEDFKAGIYYNNIGYNHSSYGNQVDAIKYFTTGLKVKNIKTCLPRIYTRLLDNLGYAEFKLGKFANLPMYYLASEKTRKRSHIENGRNFNKLYLSEYYAATKDTSTAINYAKEAFRLSKEFKAPKDMLMCLKQLSKTDTKNALKYSEQYIKISDSMQQLERENRNKFAKIAYETEEITKEKDIAVHQKSVYFTVFLGILMLLTLLLIIKVQNGRQKELQFQQVQQKANEEIYHLLLDQQNKIDLGRNLEKKRIAQELHDGIMNKLASARLNLQLIANKKESTVQSETLSYIGGIQNIEKEIRTIAHDLNNELFSGKTSFVIIVESFIAEQNAISEIKCHLEIDPALDFQQLSSEKKIHIFRILQESFQNIRKHAKAKNVIVSMLKKEDHLLFEIYDDGTGFSLAKKKKGIGLKNIYSRAQACEGSAEIKTKKGEGTTVIVVIPFADPQMA